MTAKEAAAAAKEEVGTEVAEVAAETEVARRGWQWRWRWIRRRRRRWR